MTPGIRVLGFSSSVQYCVACLTHSVICVTETKLFSWVCDQVWDSSARPHRGQPEAREREQSFSEDFVWTLHRRFQVPKPQDLRRSSSVFSWRQSSMHWTSYHRGGSISLSSSRYYRLMSRGLWCTWAWWCAIKCLLVCVYYCVHMAPDWCFGESTDLSQTFPLLGP